MNTSRIRKGKFNPKNPEKYCGDLGAIIYRSSWELKFMRWADKNPNVVQWSSEELVIPYFDPSLKRNRRYFPDFIIKALQKDGSIKTYVVEVKPKSQVSPPKPQKRRTQKYITEVMTWGTNQAKWEKAKEYCQDRNWEFMIITEDHLNIR